MTTGFLSLVTQDGLNRFDGKDFLVINKDFDEVTVYQGMNLERLSQEIKMICG